ASALGNVDGFHAAPRGHTYHPFTGAVGRDVFADNLGAADLSRGLELFAQGLADVAHGVEIIDAEVVNPFHDLAGTKTLLPYRIEEAFQLRLGQPQQVYFTGRNSHLNSPSPNQRM